MSETFSPLTTSINPNIMNSSPERSKIDRIVIHHNATTNKDVAMNTWLKGGPANTSAHYEITPTEIIGCVGEEQTAWHSGNWGINLRSIGLEHLNSTGAPNWLVDDRTLENSAKLIADICKRYSFTPSSTTIIPHCSVSATSCPFSINVNALIERAKKYYNGSSVIEPNHNSQHQKGEINMYLIQIIDTNTKYKGRWYISDGVSCRYVRTPRMLANYQNQYGKLNLPIDKMYSSELFKEFGGEQNIK